ncbi:MAG TPA: hypothetical protein VGO00_16955, partial [Kofleriaceae bacterium]|nr:hypothetical protein [Kofleriaceae bacterium]
MTDPLDDLGHELPWDRPDDARREAVRSSLLAAVGEGRLPVGRRRWTIGVAFAGGVAAAAIAAIVVWPRAGAESQHLVDVEASPAAQLEHTTTRTANGDDELVRVHAGKIRIAVGNVRPGDHVHVATGDAEIEGAASYELVAAGDRLTEVSVLAGSAVVRVRGQKPVFLAAGQSWHAAIITTDLSPASTAQPDGSSVRPDDGSALRPDSPVRPDSAVRADSAVATGGALVGDATTKPPANTDTTDVSGTTAGAASSRDAIGSTTVAPVSTTNAARDAVGSTAARSLSST